MLVFLTGWPACGKSHYGEWLATRHDFRHIDLDAGLPRGEESAWLLPNSRNRPAAARAGIARLTRDNPRLVLTRQVPTGDLALLDLLQAAGFSLWFLQARAENLSRQRWMQLERESGAEVHPRAWEGIADAIHRNARGLRPYFRDRCIETLNAGGELMSGEEFATRLGVARGVPA